MNYKQFSSLVSATRKNLGASQEQFAKKIGCSWLTIWRWEKQRSMPRADALEYWIEKIKGAE